MKHARLSAFVGAAVLAAVAAGAAASAAFGANGIEGQTSVVLDFSSGTGVQVDVYTKNLSEVPAIGRAYVMGPSGDVHSFGPRRYEPGEVWTYAKFLPGYTCADLGASSGIAFGIGLESETDDWSSGAVRYPDSRVTVIGCDIAPPSPEPSSTGTVAPTTVSQPTTVPTTAAPTTAAPTTRAGDPTSSPSATATTAAAGIGTTSGGTASPLAATGGDFGLTVGLATLGAALVVGGSVASLTRRRKA